MAAARSSLDLLTIPRPCTASWDAMKGDGRKRFCDSCRLHVYDVSTMTRAEAEALIFGSEAKVCTRLWRRADGTVVTKDCGRVRLAIERRLRWFRVAAAGVLAAVGLGACRTVPPAPHWTIGAFVTPKSWPAPPKAPDPKPADAPPPAPAPRPTGR